jgi:mitochondrial fission protein ELM1
MKKPTLDLSKPCILILSDGKPGHFNQSLGIADRLIDMQIVVAQVRYKNKLHDNFIRVITRLLGGMKLQYGFIRGLLKWSMDELSFNLLETDKFDLILSTGSSVAAPNLLMSKLTGAKAVVCTRPSPLGIKYFDLAILPEHSRPRHIPKNVLMTFGVPNRITPESISKAGLAEKLNLSESHVIGVLLGGDDPYYQISSNLASDLCDVLLNVNAQVALTTSRRTNSATEEVLKSRLANNPSCCFLVIASEGSPPNTVSGILGISEVVIVTEDSFSMVCEAASSGKKLMILNVERKRKGNLKRERVYRLMVERGYARRANISDMKATLFDLLNDTEQPKVLNDAQLAADAIMRLLY